jgi:hypothetical protein
VLFNPGGSGGTRMVDGGGPRVGCDILGVGSRVRCESAVDEAVLEGAIAASLVK